MASPGHRANILDPSYRETGIGVSPQAPVAFAGGQPGAIYTQDFGVIIGRLLAQEVVEGTVDHLLRPYRPGRL